MSKRLSFGLMLLLAGCRPSAPEPEANIHVNASNEVTSEAVSANTINAIEEPTPPVATTPADETSATAAARLVERYADLLEQRRFAEALRLWGETAKSEAELASSFDKYATIDAAAGPPGDTEGAAGSIYVDVPLTLSGTLKSGGRFTLSGPVTLRRVNDVPGSTAEQRRWHIYSTDLKPAG